MMEDTSAPEIKHEPLSPPPSDQSETPSEEPVCNGQTVDDMDTPIDFSLKSKSEDNSATTLSANTGGDTTVIKQERPISDTSSEQGSESGNENEDRNEELIGQPQPAFPGMVPGSAPFPGGTCIPPAALAVLAAQMNQVGGAGLSNGLPPGLMTGLPLGGLFDPRQFALLQAHQQAQAAAIQQQHHQQQQDQSKAGGPRPFKAYPKDPLSLHLGMYPFNGLHCSAGIDALSLAALQQSSEELFKVYREHITKTHSTSLMNRRGSAATTAARAAAPAATSAAAAAPVSPAPMTSNSSLASKATSPQKTPGRDRVASGDAEQQRESPSPSLSVSSNSSCSLSNANATSTSPQPGSTSGHPDDSSTSTRKRARCLPENQKDESYWERRRKNNEAAKRSRDARRAKEDEIAIRAAFLEQENLKLRVEVAGLKTETAKLRHLLYQS